VCFVNVDAVDACSFAANTIQLSGFDYSGRQLIRFDKWIGALIFFQLNDIKLVDLIETAHYLKLRTRRKQYHFFSNIKSMMSNAFAKVTVDCEQLAWSIPLGRIPSKGSSIRLNMAIRFD
jgi:hypothetical protein